MKFIYIIFSMLLSSQAFAHTDHALGEGSLHIIYHAVFWAVFAALIFKACNYFKAKKNKHMKNQ